nr:cation-transporting P-type ATPase [Desulfobacterales bacterium]
MEQQSVIERAPPWHNLGAEEALQRLAVTTDGISEAEAEERLARHGPNRLPPPKRRGSLARFLAQFHNVIIYVLLVAGAVTAVLGHYVDSGVIFGVVLVNALIGFIQEGKAEKALEAVRSLLSQQAMVLRDRRRRAIAADGVVPGDVIFLQSGDRVPADARLLQSRELRVDEAMLTGESLPVDKAVDPVPADAPIGDRRNLLFSGTIVTYGQGKAVVVGTGTDTEIGRISGMLAEVHTLTTPLLRQLAVFGRWLTAGILALAVLTFLFGTLLRDYSFTDMFLAAVGLAVAAIPEGLPAIITITLALGVQRMARRNAIIRRLPAVETLGSVTTICTDKTGTLTRNEMTVRTVVTAKAQVEVTGVGYEPHGGFRIEGVDVAPADVPALDEICRAAMLCNDAVVHADEGRWRADGDPTESALITLGLKAGLDGNRLAEEYPRTDVIPFESEHRFMATLHHDHEGYGFVYLKGAPESVFPRCSGQRYEGDVHPFDPDYWHRGVEGIAADAQRPLAIALRPAGHDQRMLHFDDVAGGLILVGVVGIIDPPRDEAIAAVRRCQHADIRVKMITGDHAATAASIAAQMGIGSGAPVTTGADLDGLDDAELASRARSSDVFARTSPEHKLRLVTALQSGGEVAAMTGDGVNDAPSLKRADVGVAMGIKGTEAAKQAAEMVLADDNFASIAHAVEEGRTVYDNIKKSILFILPTNGGEALTILAAIALGRLLPVTPAQILWVNMITAVTLALALAFEPAESDVMRRSPRDPREPLLTGFMLWRIGYVSLLMVTATFGLFLWERAQGTEIDTARTVAVNTLVIAEVFYLLTVRYIQAPALTPAGLTDNRAVLIAIALVIVFQLLFTHTPVLQQLFHTTDLDAEAWLRIVAVGVAILIAVELEKLVVRRLFRRRAPNALGSH